MLFKTKGMNQDLSVSAFNPEFSFENMNLRLSTNENNTTLSWVNEKGTAIVLSNNEDHDPILLVGTPIGTAVINHTLVIFTTLNRGEERSQEEKFDYIYKLEFDSTKEYMALTELYSGNLNFSMRHPLETISSYEADYIQKVYWTDGRNQPRLINIAASESSRERWGDTSFDFVPVLTKQEKVTISKIEGGGLFAPGVIQYCLTYYNKYLQQSNLFYVSPLYYITHHDRGASPEDKLSNSFSIKISDINKNFDSVRVYSVHRTSINSVPEAKLIVDIPVLIHSTSLVTEDISTSNALPIKEEQKIRTVDVVNGPYHVDFDTTKIVSKTGYSYSRTPIKLIFYNVDEHGIIDVLFYQDFKWITDKIYTDYTDSTYIDDLYSSFYFNANFKAAVDEMAQQAGVPFYALAVGWNGTYDTLDSAIILEMEGQDNMFEFKYIYNYLEQKWYITPIGSPISTYWETDSIEYTDNGTTGSSIDPYELLFIGGKEITALTMCDKDNTLFLGNITQPNSNISAIQEYYDAHRVNAHGFGISFKRGNVKHLKMKHASGTYTQTFMLDKNQEQITTFKGGETYRLGFQLQKKTGEWSEPIFIDDIENPHYPNTSMYEDNYFLPYAEGGINLELLREKIPNFDTIFISIRPVIVYPDIQDRTVLCQGVLNPTVFNVPDRAEGFPYAQASWFFRPYMSYDNKTIISSSSSNSNRVQQRSELNIEISSETTQYQDEEPTIVVDTFFEGQHALVYRGIIILKCASNLVGLQKTDKERIWSYPTLEDAENDTNGTLVDTIYKAVPTTGLIVLEQEGNNVIYALLSTEDWYEDGEKETTINEYLSYPYTRTQHNYDWGNVGHTVINRSDCRIWRDMKVTSIGELYYTKPINEEAPDPYNIQFYYPTDEDPDEPIYKRYKIYTISFGNVGSEDEDDTGGEDYMPDTASISTGTGVAFIHLDPASRHFTGNPFPHTGYADELTDVTPYTPPINFWNYNIDGYSRCDFFVDQSIVTLNSPDIDFDTSVQTYSTDKLKLRIIGAIPITSNVSSHHITKKGRTPGFGEVPGNVAYNNISVYAGQRMSTYPIWGDKQVYWDDDQWKEAALSTTYNISPWQKQGSLSNDPRADDEANSVLNTKQMANLLFSSNTEYFEPRGMESYVREDINSIIHLTENDEVINNRLPKQKSSFADINYYANINTVVTKDNAISMKYKSTSHMVLSLNASKNAEGWLYIMPYGYFSPEVSVGKYTHYSGFNPNLPTYRVTVWGDENYYPYQESINMSKMFRYNDKVQYVHNWLWLGELYKDVTNRFGGTGKTAVESNKWCVGGDSISLTGQNNAVLQWTIGDTYYQRYDCLKTYAFTPEDANQNVEILSFMCETHVNIDGRYDRNIGQVDNTNMSPQNFNLINDVYSQQDNFFTSQQTGSDSREKFSFPNQITFTKTKESGADVDLWTNITLASTLEMDGDKGEVTKLCRFNDKLFAFQDTGIAQILYNENVQVSTANGVPIEIANSGKVDGKRYINDIIGCSNKWSVVSTPSGIYFMDSNEKGIYRLGEGIQNISQQGGFNAWSKNNIPSGDVKWNPLFGNSLSEENTKSAFVAHYDRQNQDVLFINKDKALAFSEKFNTFTSFYNYGSIPYFCNLDDAGLWVRGDGYVWRHQAGGYGSFFGVNKPYWMTLVGNPEPQADKIFTNLEFRANTDMNNPGDVGVIPFNNLEVWNEYQHGIADIDLRSGHSAITHHRIDSTEASLKRKFRIWRCDIPRDNAPEDFIEDAKKGIYRTGRHPMDRIRNPWLYLKLFHSPAGARFNLNRTEIHDVVLTYFD